MLGRTHQIIGITTGLGLYLAMAEPVYNPATLGAVLVTSHLMSLLPDIDQPISEFWRTIPAGRFLHYFIDPFLKHRNLTHSILGALLVWSGFYYLCKTIPLYWGIDTSMVIFCGMAAYLSHLLADSLTEQGIPLFFPNGYDFGIPLEPFEKMRIKTGHWFENLLVFPAVNIAFIYMVYVMWPVIEKILFK